MKTPTKKKNAQPNQSLIDGITTLQALATSDRPVGGRELSRRLGFEPTRVNRLLKTLAYLGIARQTSDRKYTSGSGMHVLAAQGLFASGLVRRAVPALEELRSYNLVVAMGVLWKDVVSYIYHAPPGIASSEALGRVGIFPATRGGIGLSLLADLDDAEVSQIYNGKDIPNFPNGVNQLLEELNKIRSNGYTRYLVKPDQNQHTLAINVGQPTHSAIALSGWIPEENNAQLLSALEKAKTSINDKTSSAQLKFDIIKDREAI
ncbi:IclR family transcriptional regulator [Hirschia litorea]|uniref:IclR family transcriptional regulator n=1 Tax=Hirschia litorea TaxID=1199156 RepID=A0ABW2IPF7_9PROT